MDLKNTPNKATYMCSAFGLTNDRAVQSVAFDKSRSRCRSVEEANHFQDHNLVTSLCTNFASAAKLEVILPQTWSPHIPVVLPRGLLVS